MKKQSWIKAHWRASLGIVAMIASVIVLVLSLGLFAKTVLPENATLSDFTIVANAEDMERATAVYKAIAAKTGAYLPVVEADRFAGGHAIYLGAREYNSYGGYKYQIAVEADEKYASIYLDGTGPALEAAGAALAELCQGSKETVYPFGIEAPQVGYEWNSEDVTMTGLGFQLNKRTDRELADGVTLAEMKYKSLALGKVEAQVVIVEADADARMVVSAAAWDKSNSVDNPVQLYTTEQHGAMLTEQGYEVLAIANAGYFKKQEGSNLPWGMQILDGKVIQEPNTSEPKYTDNWVGVTKDGKYVISNTEGYNSTYKGNLQYAVGGHLVMMKDGVPTHISGTPYYRTAVGINDKGDFVILTMGDANYAVMLQVFMDLDMDIHTVLNLDGGGSTTLHAVNKRGDLSRLICGEGALERPIMDTIAFVKGKQ